MVEKAGFMPQHWALSSALLLWEMSTTKRRKSVRLPRTKHL
jgi:hypothetical protein